MKDIFIVDAARTAVGNLLGSLKDLSASQFCVPVVQALLSRNNIAADNISEVILGQVLTAGQGQNPARQTSINAAISNIVPAYGVSQVCGSGLKSIILAAQSIALGQADIILAGGQESMSRAPHSSYIRQGLKMGKTDLSDTMITEGLMDCFNNYHMGITAENIAEKYQISREEQDKFAVASQNKSENAQKDGKFKDEIIPIQIKLKNEVKQFENDEFIRQGVTLESLSKLKPSFKENGTVTAGNSSGINDGAAVMIVMSGENVKKLGLKPMAKIKSYAVTGVDPKIMGIGPVSASKKALKLAGWGIKDLDLIELNEAFAAQSIAVSKEMGWDLNKVNVNGGAIAIGHPIGASGARIVTTLLYEMRRRNAQKTIASLCIGGGMGIAMCFEAV